MTRLRRAAWILIVVVDGGFIAWGAMAWLWLDRLMGPGGKPILPAGYEGYTGASWPVLVAQAPMAAKYMEVLYRLYGSFNVVFGVMGIAIATTAFRRGERWAWWTLLVSNAIALLSAMRYDWIVNAIGPFEMTEYLGVVLVAIALAVTVRPAPALTLESLHGLR